MKQPLVLLGSILLGLGLMFVVLPMLSSYPPFLQGFVLIAIGGGLIFAHYKTPQGKAELAKAKAEEQAGIERTKVLMQRFQQFSSNPTDTESLNYVLNTLASQNKSYLKNCMRSMIIPLLKLRPLDSAIRDTVFAYAKKTITTRYTGQNEASSKEVYEAALEVLSQHPDQIPLKAYALEVGRWHYGIQRPDGKVTIYDEQAIQNDIAVRSR